MVLHYWNSHSTIGRTLFKLNLSSSAKTFTSLNLYKLLKNRKIPSSSTYSQWSKLGLCDSSVLLNGGDCDETWRHCGVGGRGLRVAEVGRRGVGGRGPRTQGEVGWLELECRGVEVTLCIVSKTCLKDQSCKLSLSHLFLSIMY